jgi:hypothetical protein
LADTLASTSGTQIVASDAGTADRSVETHGAFAGTSTRDGSERLVVAGQGQAPACYVEEFAVVVIRITGKTVFSVITSKTVVGTSLAGIREVV